MCCIFQLNYLPSEHMECVSVSLWQGSSPSTLMRGSNSQLRCDRIASVSCRFQEDATESYCSNCDTWHSNEAADLLDWMVKVPDVNDIMSIVQKCRKEKDLSRAKRVHLQMCDHGLEAQNVLANHLVTMFVCCGDMPLAQQAFQRLDERTEIAWTSMIQGFYEREEFLLILELFEAMQVNCVHPSSFTLVTLLKSCTKLRKSDKGKKIHAEIIQQGFETVSFVGNSLVDMYAKCGLPMEARDVFDELRDPDIVSWTALISGYSEQGLEEEALSFLEEMKGKGFFPSAITLFCGLKACGSIGALQNGQEIHTDIVYAGLENNLSVGNTLLDMYAKCGSMHEAQRVFDQLPTNDVVSWTALLLGYSELEFGNEALECFEQMKVEGVFPDAIAFVSGLKACNGLGDTRRGQLIHMEVAEEGFESSYLVGSALVDMYAKFGLLAEAHDVLRAMPVRDSVPWNALIGGYGEQGRGAQALSCVQAMQHEGCSLNPITFVCSLKGCGMVSDSENGQRLHDKVIKHGIERNSYVSNALIYMYTRCRMFIEAENLFNSLVVRDTISCNTMIAGYADHGYGEKALACWQQMQSEGVTANAITLVCGLQTCAILENVKKGREFHTNIVKKGFQGESIVGNAIVDMYVKCGSLTEACKVFESLLIRDVALWNTLIFGHVEHGLGGEAMKYLERMQQEDVCMDEITYVGSLKAVIDLGALNEGLKLHAQIVNDNLETNLMIGNTLIDMYAKLGMLAEGQDVFDTLPGRDVISWSALVSGYVEHNLYDTALACLENLECEELSPTALLLVRMLNACGGLKAIFKGQDINRQIIIFGLEKESFIGSALVDMYAKCGWLLEAEKTFTMLSEQDAAAWTGLIAGYSEHGSVIQTLQYLDRMEQAGFTPDAVCFLCSVKACVRIGAQDKGQELHAQIIREGLEINPYVGNSLVDMYAKFGLIVEAQDVFDELETRDVISWSSLIVGYADCGLIETAFQCLEQMQVKGVTPNEVAWNAVMLALSETQDNEDALSIYAQMLERGILPDFGTYVSIFRACGNSAALKAGQRFHSQVCNLHTIDGNGLIMTTALIDMYGKCGSMVDAQQAFDADPSGDIVKWNTLMSGYARQEKRKIVFTLWKHMRKMGLQSEVTYLSILSLCSHAGLVVKGQILFETMNQEYENAVIFKHCNCMVDLMGRAGQLEEAVHILDMMPAHPDRVAWGTVLGACRNWGNTQLSVQAFDNLSGLEEYESSVLTLMSNIYADSLFSKETENNGANEKQFYLKGIG
ncbi:hypothetical protein GOP47_0017255 [Adiantum capillus-veneris]|uniref:Pentatricopeptide repeat-containing protein n=1 Tax=Adiantum capillus-veneris TaxID=13818 RepID=A0A9D4UJC1_ADICA|nr:hypothetical protein GOP47_0017255 [Adiantum capillus-veneris]